jgi:regulatory protein
LNPGSAPAARERALRLLTVRARGRAELARALEERGFESVAVREALGRLEREGLLDDLAAARSAVRARAGRYGRARIGRELAARGFSAETVGTALAELDPEGEEKTLARLFARLWRGSAGLPADKRRRRVWSALSRRGFSAAAISAKMHVSRKDDES